jgi:uncharacterized Zn finger protein (UPF0148 family)
VTAKLAATGILCPECEIPLVHIPQPASDDLVVCPECGTGGSYEAVVEKGEKPIKNKVPLEQLRELLKRHGFTRS